MAGRFECVECGRCFTFKTNLTRHIKGAHGPNGVPESVPASYEITTFSASSLPSAIHLYPPVHGIQPPSARSPNSGLAAEQLYGTTSHVSNNGSKSFPTNLDGSKHLGSGPSGHLGLHAVSGPLGPLGSPGSPGMSGSIVSGVGSFRTHNYPTAPAYTTTNTNPNYNPVSSYSFSTMTPTSSRPQPSNAGMPMAPTQDNTPGVSPRAQSGDNDSSGIPPSLGNYQTSFSNQSFGSRPFQNPSYDGPTRQRISPSTNYNTEYDSRFWDTNHQACNPELAPETPVVMQAIIITDAEENTSINTVGGTKKKTVAKKVKKTTGRQKAADTNDSVLRPYECERCGKKFARADTLKKHIRTHTGERPYLCKICGEAFTQSIVLKKHMRRHTDERPYHCPIPGCGASFRQGFVLTEHLDAHSRGSDRLKMGNFARSKNRKTPAKLKNGDQ